MNETDADKLNALAARLEGHFGKGDFFGEWPKAVKLIRSAAAQLSQLTAEVAHWKANHDEAVRVKRALLDRPDLAERAALVQELIRERDEAVAEAESKGCAFCT